MMKRANNDMQLQQELHKLWDEADEQPDSVQKRLDSINLSLELYRYKAS